MADWYGLAAVDVVNLFRSNYTRGLTDEEVIQNRNLYGSNKVVSTKNKKLILNMVKEIINPWFVFLIFCSVIFLYLGKFNYFFITLTLNIIALVISILPHYRNYKIIKNIEKINLSKVNVLRSGKLININSEDLVVGDIVIFSKGSTIPGDIRIIECSDLKVNEVSVTGDESIIEKFSSKIYTEVLEMSEMGNMLFKSSIVQSGEGQGIVVAVGDRTEFGKIMTSTLNYDKNRNFLINKVKSGMNYISIFSFVIWVILMFFMNSNGKTLNESLYKTSFLLFSGAPINILILLYSIFRVIKTYFKSKHIELKFLSIIENLSRVNVIVTDKEEALTKSKMFVRKFYDNEAIINFDSKFIINANIKRILEIGFLCNDCTSNKNLNKTLNAAEKAIVEFVETGDVDLEIAKRVFEIPYNGNKRIKTTINKMKKRYRANVKGSVDVILKNCTHYMVDGVERELTKEAINNIKMADMKMSNECLYVMAFAYRNFTYRPSDDENIESNLVFVGLIGFESILKENTLKAVEKCYVNSIRPVVFTEDGKLGAIASGKRMNIVRDSSEVLSGVEMDNMSTEEIINNVEKVKVYSRASEENKKSVIKNLKDLGYNVLNSGSKLTELPALNEGDLFISYGENSNKIVKKLSDIDFEKNDMGIITNMIINSRKLIISLKNLVNYIFIWNFNFIVLLLLFYINDLDLKFNISEILWVLFFNVIINGIAIFLNYKKVITQYDFNLEEEVWDISLFSVAINGVIPAVIILASSAFSSINIHVFVFWAIIFEQIIYGLFDKFEKNISFFILIFLNLVFQLVIALSNLGTYMFGIDKLSMYDMRIIGIVVVVQAAVIFMKKIFTE
ncbi:P-type ATPase [Clostridium felsineum]|uniref:Calcium-transporting ATPase 1 n=1 Tax=Clostridium felsineum TaxID=36839 RepID=A0A1S8MAS8_9CLOT|nr:cation-transporting P-type ATPase [Clostridium felsineum]URZ01168.1 Calcium-transporting ATPase 1 [Clostridium felsineum]URZ06077.1 Calcium-transporting ATPase 1 [Clostridium felsineum]URZ11114.1 Calcium-transporting ATPase 1 [Clostridium felsineum]